MVGRASRTRVHIRKGLRAVGFSIGKKKKPLSGSFVPVLEPVLHPKSGPVLNPRPPPKPVGRLSIRWAGFPPRAQITALFLRKQSDLIPGIRKLYLRILHNPSFYSHSSILVVTENKKLDQELARNVSLMDHFFKRFNGLNERVKAEKNARRRAALRNRQGSLLEQHSERVRRNRQILIDFLYPNKP